MSNETEQNFDELEDELIIDLRKSITVGSETVHQITLREPEGHEIELFHKAVDKIGPMGAVFVFIAAISGVSKQVISKMGARDLDKAQRYLMAFLDLSGSRQTGGKS
ncbi:MAG: phage tail assembly protein [Collimonas sp.]|uniref:phage tail assembly protein n=1 Tax=Collimonas sp. TaxID=1963772 RepID=UPI0032657D4F